MLRTVEGCGVILISRDWILPLVPLFSRDEKIAPNFAKNLTVPSFGEFSYKQTAKQIKTGKYFFKRAIIAPNFGKKIFKSPFTHFRGTVSDALGVTNERTTACYGVSRNSRPLVISESRHKARNKLTFKIGPSLIKYSLALRYAKYFRFLC